MPLTVMSIKGKNNMYYVLCIMYYVLCIIGDVKAGGRGLGRGADSCKSYAVMQVLRLFQLCRLCSFSVLQIVQVVQVEQGVQP